MTHLIHRLANALREPHAEAPVHFHADEDGRPYVCEHPRCSSPSLTTTRW